MIPDHILTAFPIGVRVTFQVVGGLKLSGMGVVTDYATTIKGPFLVVTDAAGTARRVRPGCCTPFTGG